MRRSILLTLAVLGGLVSLIGGVGLFAALTDTARTGTNSVESAALGASADIQLAKVTPDANGGMPCGFGLDLFQENLSTGFFDITGVTVGYISPPAYFCVRNVGSQEVALSALADELVDVEVACTGDEELNGDTSCTPGAAGELAGVLGVEYISYPLCTIASATSDGSPLLADNATTPKALGFIPDSATRCFGVRIFYLDIFPATTLQRAQSDRVTWRFRFDAQA